MRTKLLLSPLAAALVSLPAAAQNLCDPVLDNVECPAGSINKYCPVVLNSSCSTGKMQLVLDYTVAPPLEHTSIYCGLELGRYFCEGWPRGGGISYHWSVTGSLQIDGVSNEDLVDISCTFDPRNKITLTVTSPYGLSTSVEMPAHCGDSLDPL